MEWIEISSRAPENGMKVKIRCDMTTEAIYEPKDGIDWYQEPNAPTQASVTHWCEIKND